MAYCKQCGASIPDFAKFCPKCGIAEPVGAAQSEVDEPSVKPIEQERQTDTVSIRNDENVPPPAVQTQTTPQPQTPQNGYDNGASSSQPKPLDFSWFNNHFILLFVIMGLTAYVLSQLSGTFISISVGFGVVLGIFAIIFAAGTLTVAIVRYIASLRDGAELRKKFAMRDRICLAVGIIEFLFILLLCIAVFILGDRLSGII